MEFGKFAEVTFSNGGTPAINDTNLNELERVVGLTDEELGYSSHIKFIKEKQYYLDRNTRSILGFYNYTDWTNHYPSQLDLSDESDENVINNQCLRCDNLLATAGWMSFSQTASSIDFTQFEDGSSSSVDDILCFFIYISDASAFSQLEVRLGDDFSNCYFIELADIGLNDGWNNLYPQKSDFTTVGAPTGWNDITYIRLAPYVEAGYSGEYVLFQKLQIYRQDPDYSGFANVFQKYNGSTWENEYFVDVDVCGLYMDNCDAVMKSGFMLLNTVSSTVYNLLIYENVIDFRGRFEFYCKNAGESPSIVWRVDNSNFIEVYVSSDTFYLKATEATVETSNSEALSTSLLKNEKIYIEVQKKDDSIRAILYKIAEEKIIIEYATSISSTTDGDVYIGKSNNESLGLLTDFHITNEMISTLDYEEFPIFVRKGVTQSFVNNTLANVTGMKFSIEKDCVYIVEAVILVTCTSATPDVKLAWSLTNCTMLGNSRPSWGPSTTTTSISTTTIKSSSWGPTSQATYGCDGGTNESIIYETFLLRGDNYGAIAQLQGAQSSTDAGNPTTIYSSSFIKIFKAQPQAF